MKILKNYKPEKITKKGDEPLPANKVLIDFDKAVAINGTAMVIFPLELEETDASKTMIDPYIFEEVRKHTEGDSIKFNLDREKEKAVLDNGIELPFMLKKPEKELIPFDYESIIPTNKPKCMFSLNAGQLAGICLAFHSKSIVIEFYGYDKPLKIKPLDSTNKAAGYLTQIKFSDSEENK